MREEYHGGEQPASKSALVGSLVLKSQ